MEDPITMVGTMEEARIQTDGSALLIFRFPKEQAKPVVDAFFFEEAVAITVGVAVPSPMPPRKEKG